MSTTGDTERVALLVELTSGEVVAVEFRSRELADWWEQRMPFEVVGRPRMVSARSLAVGVAMRERRGIDATSAPGNDG